MKTAAFVAWGLLVPAFAQKPQIWTIEGDVFLGDHRVAQATVWPRGTEQLRAVDTDDKGHYVLTGSAPGTYAVYATKEHSGASRTRSVNVLPGTKTNSIDLHLDNTIAISGKVFDSDGTPLAAISVTALAKTFRDGVVRFDPKGNTTTNKAGEYTIDDLPEGRFYVSASQTSTVQSLKPRKRTNPGHEREPVAATMLKALYPNAESIEEATPVRLATGEHRSGVDIVLSKTLTVCLYATVADVPEAGPHGSATFQVFQAMGEMFPSVASGQVPLGDEIEVCGVPSGSYRVIATSANQDPVTDMRTFKTTGFVRTEVILGKRDVDLKTLYPQPGIGVRGVVMMRANRDEDRPPIPPGISVALDQQGRPIYGGEDRIRRPGDDGQFLFDTVLPDDYRLRVSGLPSGYYVHDADQQGRDALRETVRPGRGDLHITLAPDGAIISGQTVDSDHQPVADAIVILANDEGRPLLTRQSDQNGQFQFISGIAPGKYRLLALVGLFEGEEQDAGVIGRNLSSAVKLDLASGAKQNLELIVRRMQ